MKNDDLKTIQQNILSYNATYDIINWGSQNDYPQQILRLVNNSVTAQECIQIYNSFLIGNGFKDTRLNDLEINLQGDNLLTLLQKIVYDYVVFGGFALHVKYNAFLQVREIFHIPFEQVRLGGQNENYQITNVSIHWDWGKEYQRVRRFDKDDIYNLPFFNDTREQVIAEILDAGSFEDYKGQCFFFSNVSKRSYPSPFYSASMKDMNTEDGISIVDNRNAYNRFMPSGALVQVLGNGGIDDALANEKSQMFADTWERAQGPDSLGKIIAMTVQDRNDIPEFINMQPNNYARDYEVTSNKIKKNIRQSFHIPPILCSENVSTGFDTNAMQSAFIYFNSITERERKTLSNALKNVFNAWFEDLNGADFEIEKNNWQITI